MPNISINTRALKRLGLVAAGGALVAAATYLTNHPIGDATISAVIILGLREVDKWVNDQEASA